ncbi:Hypothetical protein PHPALM_17773, partial [Phytophthora palmivora]
MWRASVQSSSRSFEAKEAILLTAVQFVIRERLHTRGIDLGHVSRAIDDFVNELSRDWSLEDAYKKTKSLRCMQYFAAREPKELQPFYQAWIVNNVAEMTIRSGDIKSLQWLVEQYAPQSSITKAAVVAAAEGRLDVLQWLFKNHNTRVHWGGAEWCEGVSGDHKDVMEWLRCHVKLHAEAAPQLMLDAARTGDLLLVQSLHKNYKLPLSNALIEAEKGCQWGVVEWILTSREVEDPKVDMDNIAAQGDIDFLQWIYSQGVGRFTTHSIESAAFNGHLSILEWLHDGPAKIELSTSVLNEAARGGKVEVVKWLHEHQCHSTSAAMEAAAENGYLEVMQWLYANTDVVCTSRALDRAARNGHLDIVKWLHATDINLYCPAAMNRAAEFGHLHVVKWLHENRPEGCSTEALDCACHLGHLDVAKWLYANRREGCGKWAMDLAASCGHLHVLLGIGQCCTPGINLYCPAAMNRAAEFGHLHVVKWLHENRPEGCSTEALDCACHLGHLDVAKWLYANRREGCGKWAMDLAASCGHLHVVKWLYQDLHKCCSSWALDSAARQGHLDVVKWLHSNQTEACTAEAMSSAAANGHIDVVRWLHHNRSEGCDPTALNRAIAGGHLEVAMFLHRERGLTCSFRNDVTLRGLRLEMVQWLLSMCCNELEHSIKFQVARCDWYFNDWVRSQGLQMVNQDDSTVVWEWRTD